MKHFVRFDRLLVAAIDRLRLRRTRGPSPPAPAGEIVLRLCRGSDQQALERLAALESRPLPRGSFVVVVADGELVVAVPLDDDVPALADPFRYTAPLVTLATQRTRELRKAEARAASTSGRQLARAH